MSSYIYPSTLNYVSGLNAVAPDINNSEMNMQPQNNKASFTNGEFIDFIFPKNGELDQDSVYFNATCNYTTNNTSGAVLSVPSYAFMGKIEETSNQGAGPINNTIPNYNILIHDSIQLTQNSANKIGKAPMYGYKQANETLSGQLIPMTDGRVLDVSGVNSFPISCPLPYLLCTSSEQMLPLEYLGGYRIRIYIDQLSNFVNNTTVVTGFTLTNVSLTYDLVTAPSLETSLRNLGNISIKTSTFGSASTTLPQGSTGFQSIPFQFPYNSVRSITLHNGKSSGTNKIFDSYDITTNGSYYVTMNNKSYPTAPLSIQSNRAQIQTEALKAWGYLSNTNGSCAINNTEFSYVINDTTSLAEPAKLYLCADTSRISSMVKGYLNGYSTGGNSLYVNYNMSTGIPANVFVAIFVNYDCVINIDTVNKSANLVF